MYASKIVETADVKSIFAGPLHPYTKGLLRSLPKLGQVTDRLETIDGVVPDPLHFPAGCKFHPRCSVGCNDPRCKTVEPELRQVRPDRYAACWYIENYQTEQEKKEYQAKYAK
jgi:oligopeptide/dipeptide ABC transporter ATP-binding protein